jgi:hypothetical protein
MTERSACDEHVAWLDDLPAMAAFEGFPDAGA